MAERLPLVAEQVVLGGDDQRRRQPRQILGEERGHQGRQAKLGIWLVHGDVVLHLRGRQPQPSAVVGHRLVRRSGRVMIPLGDGIEQDLRTRQRAAPAT